MTDKKIPKVHSLWKHHNCFMNYEVVLISNEYSDPVDMTPEDLNDLIEKTHLTDAQESTQSSQLQESFANIQENYFSAAGTTPNEVSTTANDLENSLRYMDV